MPLALLYLPKKLHIIYTAERAPGLTALQKVHDSMITPERGKSPFPSSKPHVEHTI